MTIDEARAYVATLTLTTLRKAWARNRRASHDAIWSPYIHRGLMTERDQVLIPEFTRRGFICADPQNGWMLDQPRKAQA